MVLPRGVWLAKMRRPVGTVFEIWAQKVQCECRFRFCIKKHKTLAAGRGAILAGWVGTVTMFILWRSGKLSNL